MAQEAPALSDSVVVFGQDSSLACWWWLEGLMAPLRPAPAAKASEVSCPRTRRQRAGVRTGNSPVTGQTTTTCAMPEDLQEWGFLPFRALAA